MSPSDQNSFGRLLNKLTHIKEVLPHWVAVSSHVEKQKLDWALKSIENVSFKQLAANYNKVLARLVSVYDDHVESLE